MPEQTQSATMQLPLFYRSIRPLDRARDKDLCISRTNFRFAARTNAIPVTLDEFPRASAYFPIVFAKAAPRPFPVAIVGIQKDSNLFVGPDGRWKQYAYVPNYVHRYPFALVDNPNTKQSLLCIDETAEILGPGGEPLFDGEAPSKVTTLALQLCNACRLQGNLTERFTDALLDFGLLTEPQFVIDTPGGKIRLQGFLNIDEKRFKELPKKALLKWQELGWLGLTYAQLLSSHRWQNLRAMLPESEPSANQSDDKKPRLLSESPDPGALQ
jgi:hypothetical protein